MAEIKYDCMSYLVGELYKKDQAFKTHAYNYPPPSDWKQDFLFIYITTVLLNNRPFFDSKFDDIPWRLSFSDFETSYINGNNAVNYTHPKERLREEKNVATYYGALKSSKPESYMYSNGQLTKYYKDYLESKYQGDYDAKRYGDYTPDPLEQIAIDQYYEDQRKKVSDKKAEELSQTYIDDEEYYWEEKEREYDAEFRASMETLNEWLTKDKQADFGKILRNIRNALAHSQWKIVGSNLILTHYMDEEKLYEDFTCTFSATDMIKILTNYYELIREECNKRNLNNSLLLEQILTGNIGYNSMSFNEIADTLLTELKDSDYYPRLVIVIKAINEIDEQEVLEFDYSDFEDPTDEEKMNIRKNELLFTALERDVSKEFQDYFPFFKFQQLSYIIEETLLRYSEDYKSKSTYEEIEEIEKNNQEEAQELYEEIRKNNKQDPFMSDFKEDLTNINVLLNLIFVQQDYDNINTSMLNFNKLELDTRYIEDCKKRLKPDIDGLTQQYNMRQISLNNVKKQIEENKIPEDKKQQVLNNAIASVREKEKALASKKQELNYLISLNNKTKFRHLRNSFAHGNYSIEMPNGYTKLSDLVITIKDYKENNTGKEILTFMASIKLGDLLEQMLKPELVTQLYMQEMLTSNPPGDNPPRRK